jgi:hypothetical protein
MKSKKIMQNTTNRSEFNKAYKYYLEATGEIHCSYCCYHKGENSKKKYFGGYLDIPDNVIHPNWKLTTRNRKQWMNKEVEVYEKINRYGRPHLTIAFKKQW